MRGAARGGGGVLSPGLTGREVDRNVPDARARATQIRLTEEDRKCWIDLSPYYNATPFVVQERAGVERVFRLFRTLGLRHLCVVRRLCQATEGAARVAVGALCDERPHPPRPAPPRRARSIATTVSLG